MNWRDRSNPCSYETYARIMSWAETDCWCCTGTRGVLVGMLIGAVAALTGAGMYVVAMTVAIGGAPLVAVLLYVARELWTEEIPDEDAGER